MLVFRLWVANAPRLSGECCSNGAKAYDDNSYRWVCHEAKAAITTYQSALLAEMPDRADLLDNLYAEMHRRMDQPRSLNGGANLNRLIIDDTQLGVEFAFEELLPLLSLPGPSGEAYDPDHEVKTAEKKAQARGHYLFTRIAEGGRLTSKDETFADSKAESLENVRHREGNEDVRFELHSFRPEQVTPVIDGDKEPVVLCSHLQFLLGEISAQEQDWRDNHDPNSMSSGATRQILRDGIEKLSATPPQGEVEPYDTGILNDWGGGNIGWWQDYIRAEIGRCEDHHQATVDQLVAEFKVMNDTHTECAAELFEANQSLSTIRQETIEECAKVAEGWPTEAAGDNYQTNGNGRFWDAGTNYDQSRIDAGAAILQLGGKTDGLANYKTCLPSPPKETE